MVSPPSTVRLMDVAKTQIAFLDPQIVKINTVALRAALRAGAIQICQHHPEVWIRVGDRALEDRARSLAPEIWATDDLAQDRKELMNAVVDVFDLAAEDECPTCAASKSA